MSRSDAIAPHLPYLRRYARALTGSQESGDKYVLTVLETLIEDPDADLVGENPKVELFTVFNRIWQSLDVNLQGSETGSAAERKVTSLTAKPRQAFLLTSVEGFSASDTAKILGTDEAGIRELIDRAGAEISAQVSTSVMIIEDEPLIAMDIEQMVQGLGHEVTGIARTHREAMEMIGKDKPGMVLADIQLADGSSGIDAVNEILRSINVPVIFITAFPERLLTGERPEPAFLITKPFLPETVKALISQALFFEQNAGVAA